MDCGPTCLRMISQYYGREISKTKLKLLSETNRTGSNLRKLAEAAEKIGFRSLGVKLSFDKLSKEAPLPCILHWNQNHFVVVYKIKKNFIYVADPAHGKVKLNLDLFLRNWISDDNLSTKSEGYALLIEPTPVFFRSETDDRDSERHGFRILLEYTYRYRKFIFQLIIGLVVSSLLQMTLPFLTQSIVDVGIKNHDINFIYLVLIAQLFVFLGKISIEIIRGWILLYLSTRINIALVSDFFIKLMNLPISYFDSKLSGDLIQRMQDHKRVEKLLTTTSLTVLFSFFNLIIFGIILWSYNFEIFLVFLFSTIIYVIWVLSFLKKRRILDYKHFNHMSDEQEKVYELIIGMQEIKLHNAEQQKRWGWEYLQARLFKIETKNLVLEQIQSIGASFINELKNIIITIIAAKYVIGGSITLGMMMSITYIIGQLNSPVQQLIQFVFTAQDAKISLERISEIYNLQDENSNRQNNATLDDKDLTIKIENLNFRYLGSSEDVLKNVNLIIPMNKTTAIVGSSGSGKTTLLKIILKFYAPQSGEIMIGNTDLNDINNRELREVSGVVMQDGFIFNDSIANNIALGDDQINWDQLKISVKVACIEELIDSLPLGLNTKIGVEGFGLSAGQIQRILIARAVYKSPKLICFDEATSSLDSINENMIIQNLNDFFRDRTAIIIAHRLSTVKNADQIVVMDKGKIIEIGVHDELVKKNGAYHKLVKNQLVI